ncbi:unnamed protein product [Prorocentrum cordatum]|uniref:Uncharacterized protein n=1 Tax=Prorocentrum cordatum TaxID=2364126 RepID=A0ABN9UL01_9DINO|nr:unnamed protein product [Polarella glacialis]
MPSGATPRPCWAHRARCSMGHKPQAVGQAGVRPEAALNVAISKCGRARQWSAALTLFRAASEARARVDTVLYNVAIAACGKGGQWPEALLLLGEIADGTLEPDVISTTPGLAPARRVGSGGRRCSC